MALAWVAPALLVVVATVQLSLALTQELTPWKGGGFGMFATVDEPGTRVIEVSVRTGGETQEVVLDDPEAVEPVASSWWLEAARSLPTEPLSARAADELDEVAWAEQDEGLAPVAPDEGEHGTIREIRVVRPALDGVAVSRETVATWSPRR